MKPISLTKIADNLSDNEHRKIAEQLAIYKIDGIELSIAGGRWGATWETNKDYDLSFLKFYKGIKVIRIFLPGVTDIKPILHLADSLENLQLGEFNNKKISFAFFSDLPNLKYLGVVKQPKGLESIVQLPKLTELTLTGYSIDKLSFLNDLKNLRRLYIGFGTSKNIDTISQLENLEELDILWVKQLEEINAISKLTSLIKLKIENEKQIKTLPDLSQLKRLKNIRLMNISTLEDISSLTNSYVDEFIITGPNKNTDILIPIAKSNCVKKVYTYFYLKKEQAKAEQLLGNKFCPLSKMEFEMTHLKQVSLYYYDSKTGEEIE
ncbi:leucine-rich repeat domain-containing protein [Flavobacterium petrolei]|uniref:Leucine-rich repeat domain-containing protein n=1 Tax=Flavobacterium petrolei TaxID=2259594 RepID=A0A482TRJ9_9FLAO|nr:leucine-rich repeat domain-containing protein [Flavobacterium petrolei]RYJ50914.1 leucine-rich repeat domain-containing protein [Flavobacterium petrolei]